MRSVSPEIPRWHLELSEPTRPDDMHIPGYKFHLLKGAWKGAFAASVSGNWRLTFEFDDQDAVSVDLEGNH